MTGGRTAPPATADDLQNYNQTSPTGKFVLLSSSITSSAYPCGAERDFRAGIETFTKELRQYASIRAKAKAEFKQQIFEQTVNGDNITTK